VINCTHNTLPQKNTTLESDTHPKTWRDSNPHSRQTAVAVLTFVKSKSCTVFPTSQSPETDANMAIRQERTISCMLIVIPEIHKHKLNFLFQLCSVLFYAFVFRPRALIAELWTTKCPKCRHCYFGENSVSKPTAHSCSRRPVLSCDG